MHYNLSRLNTTALPEGWARFETCGEWCWDFDREHFPMPEVAWQDGEWQHLLIWVSYPDQTMTFEDDEAARFIEWTWREGMVKPRR